jgi:pimeloyl-ACP methyl ester carboxylesterase
LEFHNNQMTHWKNIDYSKIDIPEINNIVFYPRRDPVCTLANQFVKSIMIPTSDGEVISTIWSEKENMLASILFFHGNGEIASEYLDIAHIFLKMGIRFICADYRGYGHSSGTPSITSMIEDAHDIFKYVHNRLLNNNEPLIVMGRSLGTASALELAAMYDDKIDGLIVESGFAETMPLLRTLGADPEYLQINERDGFANSDKISKFSNPLLIIHAEEDFLISLEQAEKLHAAAGSLHKEILRIPAAGHNDIFFTGMEDYLKAVYILLDFLIRNKKNVSNQN